MKPGIKLHAGIGSVVKVSWLIGQCIKLSGVWFESLATPTLAVYKARLMST